jgi:hypothetical protein
MMIVTATLYAVVVVTSSRVTEHTFAANDSLRRNMIRRKIVWWRQNATT